MAYAEKRGDYYRARWRGPDGNLEASPASMRFPTKTDAVKYGQDQESAIRNNTYMSPRAGKITLSDWVNLWFPALDLELNTLDNYRYLIEVHILPTFGDRELVSLTPEEIAAWEKNLSLSRRTAREARALLTNILNDAIPRYIPFNPSARRRGKGRRGGNRIHKAEKAEKAWATPLQVLLLAERCAVLAGDVNVFVMVVVMAYLGARWGEILALGPGALRPGEIDLHWKLYELNGRFYKGRPKDGSMRTADLPPFLEALLLGHIAQHSPRKCTCCGREEPWCSGGRFYFLAASGSHYRRSNFGRRVFRPAADGWYPAIGGKAPKLAMPVLVDVSQPYPGKPLPPWPPAEPGLPFAPPTGRGVLRLTSGADGRGRCSHCYRNQLLRLDGTLVGHKLDGSRCPGAGRFPAEDVPAASWLPISPNLTPHGTRHGHQTWMDDEDIPYVLQSERMGHEIPGMRGIYTHVTDAMRARLIASLQEMWEEALRQRAQMSPRSLVPVLDELLVRLAA